VFRRCDNLTEADGNSMHVTVKPDFNKAMKNLSKETDKCVGGWEYGIVKLCKCSSHLCNHAPSVTSYSLALMTSAVTSLILGTDVAGMLLFWN